jgi:hypothetical protein
VASKYGAIYWIDRRKAARISEQAMACGPMLQRMADALALDSGVNRIFNHAVCAWVHARPERLKYSRIRLPRNGIMSVSGDAIYVNRRDFELQTPETAYDCPDALYDLHDFVHHVCACISPELYGCKYFDLFARFDAGLQGLVRDSRHAGDTPNPYGDSLMFRQLSLALFDAMQGGDASDRRIVESIADDLARYLRGEAALLQPSTGRSLSVPEMLGPVQLAVLSENKAYEHTASECEEFMFVRGGAGATADEFSGMATAARIAAIADAPLGYFERRNFLRHRAQKRAYLLHALYLLESGLVDDVERELLADIIDNLTFADHVSRRRIDLFERVSALPESGQCGGSGVNASNVRACA